MGTDADWELWGQNDPYYGVLSTAEFHTDQLDDASREKFFATGADYIDRTLATVRAHLAPDHRPRHSLDFGCGVGRLVIPLAGRSESVVGVDVSDTMLAEAAANCERQGIENASFVKSDDTLSRLDGDYDFINSCLVLQHIPVTRGMQVIGALLSHLAPGGVITLQFPYRCDAPRLARALVRLRYRLPVLNHLRNLLRGRPWNEPAMQMHTYDLEAVIGSCRQTGVDRLYLELYKDADFQTVRLYGQRILPASNG